jgi:hypothetical protein
VGLARRREPILGVAIGSLALGAFALLLQCTVSTSGAGPTADGGRDVTTIPDTGSHEDVVVEVGADAPGPCKGVLCNGSCLGASDCRTCPSAALLCAPTGHCVSSCADCADDAGAKLPIGCFACDHSHQNPLGSCQPDDASAYCLSGDYFGAYVGGGVGYQCDCSEGGVSACPGPNQVCAPTGSVTLCFACGETTVAQIDGGACRGGGNCDLAGHTCH